MQSQEQMKEGSSTEFEPSQSGRYRIEVTARSEGQNVADAFVVIEVASRGNETDGLPVDHATLDRWAAATGGRRVEPNKPNGWIEADSRSSTTVVRRQSLDLWHNFSLILLLCVLLATDWTLRLFRGYV